MADYNVSPQCNAYIPRRPKMEAIPTPVSIATGCSLGRCIAFLCIPIAALLLLGAVVFIILIVTGALPIGGGTTAPIVVAPIVSNIPAASPQGVTANNVAGGGSTEFTSTMSRVVSQSLYIIGSAYQEMPSLLYPGEAVSAMFKGDVEVTKSLNIGGILRIEGDLICDTITDIEMKIRQLENIIAAMAVN